MINKKVYLAKNTLASGFDVEYVKSNLSRIPGIVIIEANSNFFPSDCSAFVIVPDANSKYLDEDSIYLSKNVYYALNEFIENYKGKEDIADCIYIFDWHKDSIFSGDVEKTFPISFFAHEELNISIKNEESYDSYSTIDIVREEISLLGAIAEIIDEDNISWVKLPRHFTPPPIFAVPPVPSLEERKLKNCSFNKNSSSFDINSVQNRIDEIIKEGRKRLLLLRRK